MTRSKCSSSTSSTQTPTGSPTRLPRERAIGCLSDVTDAARLRRELQLRASVDSLTGCLNRSATLELLDATLRDHATFGVGTAVVFVDLDGFKFVNDHYGHATGDAVLRIAAQRIQGVTRQRDHVGRLGSDEFLVLCPDVTHADSLDIVERLHRSLHDELHITEHRPAYWLDLQPGPSSACRCRRSLSRPLIHQPSGPSARHAIST